MRGLKAVKTPTSDHWHCVQLCSALMLCAAALAWHLQIVELVPGGREVKVTEANKHEYVNLIARHRMTTSIKAQIQVRCGLLTWQQ
jgi:hypothetical protein